MAEKKKGKTPEQKAATLANAKEMLAKGQIKQEHYDVIAANCK